LPGSTEITTPRPIGLLGFDFQRRLEDSLWVRTIAVLVSNFIHIL